MVSVKFKWILEEKQEEKVKSEEPLFWDYSGKDECT